MPIAVGTFMLAPTLIIRSHRNFLFMLFYSTLYPEYSKVLISLTIHQYTKNFCNCAHRNMQGLQGNIVLLVLPFIQIVTSRAVF